MSDKSSPGFSGGTGGLPASAPDGLLSGEPLVRQSALQQMRIITLPGAIGAMLLAAQALLAARAETDAQAAETLVRVKVQLIQIDSPQAALAFPTKPPGTSMWEPADVGDPVIVLVDPTTHPTGLGAMLVDQDHTVELAGVPCRYHDGELGPAKGNGAPELPSQPWNGKTIAAPTLQLEANKKAEQKAELTVGQSVPRVIQRKDGSIEADGQTYLDMGIHISLLVDHATRDGVSFADLQIRRTYFQHRTPVAPVAFDSGLTVTTSLETGLSFVLPPGKFALLKLPAAPKDAAVFAVLSAAVDPPSAQSP